MYLPKILPKLGKTRQEEQKALDEAESEKVRQRSGGQCEVVETEALIVDDTIVLSLTRCPRKAYHVMHLIGGRGKRGIGISALAEHKLHGCPECHRDIDGDIGGKRLVRVSPDPVPHWEDPYERIRG
jgi:hypothetical protein